MAAFRFIIDPPMNDSISKTSDKKKTARCSECDRETVYFNVWHSPSGTERVICWECTAREEKGFFAQRGFQRGARTGVIPR